MGSKFTLLLQVLVLISMFINMGEPKSFLYLVNQANDAELSLLVIIAIPPFRIQKLDEVSGSHYKRVLS